MGQIMYFLLLIFSIFKHDQIEFFLKFQWILKVKEITNTAGRSKFFFFSTILPIPSSDNENALCSSYNNCLELNNWQITLKDIGKFKNPPFRSSLPQWVKSPNVLCKDFNHWQENTEEQN